MKAPEHESTNLSQPKSIKDTKKPVEQLMVQKIPPSSSCILMGMVRTGAQSVESMNAEQLQARVAGPMPGKLESSQICVRMVIQEEQGVKSKKKYRLIRKVQAVAPIIITTPPARFSPSNVGQKVTLIGNCEFIFVIDMTTKIVASAYLIGSALLFAFPAIAHRIHKYNNSTLQEALQQRRILKICHRGSPRKAAENTMPSFEEGARVGDMLEMDVCFTKDEVLVVHHDLDLHRTCGVPGKISEMSYSELPRLKNEIELQFAEQGRTIKTNGEAIPTLEQVFVKFPNTLMNIQLKTSSEIAIAKLISLVNRFNRIDLTILGIRGDNFPKLSLYDPNIIRFCSDREVSLIILAYFTGLLPYLKIQAQALQIPLFTTHFYQWKKRQWNNPVKAYLFFAMLKAMNQLMKPLAWHLRRRGVMTYHWVCNNEEEFSRAIDCGAVGIITDEPVLLDEYLKANCKGKA